MSQENTSAPTTTDPNAGLFAGLMESEEEARKNNSYLNESNEGFVNQANQEQVVETNNASGSADSKFNPRAAAAKFTKIFRKGSDAGSPPAAEQNVAEEEQQQAQPQAQTQAASKHLQPHVAQQIVKDLSNAPAISYTGAPYSKILETVSFADFETHLNGSIRQVEHLAQFFKAVSSAESAYAKSLLAATTPQTGFIRKIFRKNSVGAPVSTNEGSVSSMVHSILEKHKEEANERLAHAETLMLYHDVLTDFLNKSELKITVSSAAKEYKIFMNTRATAAKSKEAWIKSKNEASKAAGKPENVAKAEQKVAAAETQYKTDVQKANEAFDHFYNTTMPVSYRKIQVFDEARIALVKHVVHRYLQLKTTFESKLGSVDELSRDLSIMTQEQEISSCVPPQPSREVLLQVETE